MKFFRAGILAAILLHAALESAAFSTTRSVILTRSFTKEVVSLRMGDDKDDDPTKVWYAGVADMVQKALTNSPLNEGKKALVKSLAGNYDQAAVRARLENWIGDQEKPVLMLSFRT